jgi:REP element-mobilizing transposase RayT
MSFRNGTLHVTIRLVDGLPNLRTPRTVRWIRRCLELSGKPGFRVVHYSVQGNHLHLIVEASDPDQLSRGMRGLCARLSRRLNQLFGRHRKSVFDGRYHARLLASPAEVR